MTDWHPPLASGLARGTRTPEQALADHADGTIDAVHRPAVYCLRLSTPSEADAYRRLWDAEHGARHRDLSAMIDCEKLFYVGAAADAYERLCQHLRNPNQSGAVPRVFPIHSVERVWWYEDREEAFTHESRHAIELSNEGPHYVSQN